MACIFSFSLANLAGDTGDTSVNKCRSIPHPQNGEDHLRGSPVCQELGGRWGKREDSRQTLWEQCPFSDQCPVHSVTPSPWTNSTVYLLPSRVLGAEDRVLDRGTLILVEKTV